ncbi:hypothetical protein ID866_3614 [Astraeus odoratus]|nr:hypothetical protein ID866_3614 [Astraeus odoratus]
MDPVKRKVTAKLVHDTGNTYARVQTPSRPGSPTKRASPSPLPPSPFRPKAKVNGGATVRKLSSSSSLNVSKSNDPSLSRPGSPFKSLRPITNGSPSLPARVKAPVTSRPTSAAGRSPTSHGPTTSESRQRSLTSASPKLRPPIPDDRPRSGSVGLQQATSSPDLKLHPFPAQTSPLSDRSTVDQDQLGSPVLFSAKIRSKVSNLARSVNTSDASSPSSPPLATTHPIHVETRAPSFPSNVSLNTPISSPPSNPILYPITTAVPAANPYRYNAARPVQPPARNPQSVTSIQDMPTPKKSPLVPKVDPAAVPLTPQSPPISALSLSSKSSLSQTSNSSTTDLSVSTGRVHETLRFLSQISRFWMTGGVTVDMKVM